MYHPNPQQNAKIVHEIRKNPKISDILRNCTQDKINSDFHNFDQIFTLNLILDGIMDCLVVVFVCVHYSIGLAFI